MLLLIIISLCFTNGHYGYCIYRSKLWICKITIVILSTHSRTHARIRTSSFSFCLPDSCSPSSSPSPVTRLFPHLYVCFYKSFSSFIFNFIFVSISFIHAAILILLLSRKTSYFIDLLDLSHLGHHTHNYPFIS